MWLHEPFSSSVSLRSTGVGITQSTFYVALPVKRSACLLSFKKRHRSHSFSRGDVGEYSWRSARYLWGGRARRWTGKSRSLLFEHFELELYEWKAVTQKAGAGRRYSRWSSTCHRGPAKYNYYQYYYCNSISTGKGCYKKNTDYPKSMYHDIPPPFGHLPLVAPILDTARLQYFQLAGRGIDSL
jgi:hypothetical protein